MRTTANCKSDRLCGLTYHQVPVMWAVQADSWAPLQLPGLFATTPLGRFMKSLLPFSRIDQRSI
jgi:hypothetical protein